MWLNINQRTIDLLEKYGANYRVQCYGIQIEYKTIIDQKPILGYLLEDEVFFSDFTLNYSTFNCAYLIKHLIECHYDLNILEHLFSTIHCGSTLQILVLVNYKKTDIDHIILLLNYCGEAKKKEIYVIFHRLVSTTDNIKIFKILMDKFNLTDVKLLTKIFNTCIEKLRTDIFRHLIVRHQIKLKSYQFNNIFGIIKTRPATETIKFSEMLIELHDSGYFQDLDWKKMIKVINIKYADKIEKD
jgi:hypothetical protein